MTSSEGRSGNGAISDRGSSTGLFAGDVFGECFGDGSRRNARRQTEGIRSRQAKTESIVRTHHEKSSDWVQYNTYTVCEWSIGAPGWIQVNEGEMDMVSVPAVACLRL